jgi:DivIVA domain-containing protein
MALTPDDVANKRFTPTRFKTGYDEEEVDAFLDEVEAELRRLLTENADLRQSLQQAPASAGSGAGPGIGPSGSVTLPPFVVAESPAPPPLPPPTPPPPPPPSPPREEPQEQALRTLLLAQRTGDEAIAQAKAEAEQIVTQARSQAARIEQEAARQHAAAMVDFQRQRNSLESSIDGLRSFEREYRTRLKAYLETQLRDLNGRGPIAPPGGPVAGSPSVQAPAATSPGSPPASSLVMRPHPVGPPPSPAGGEPSSVSPGSSLGEFSSEVDAASDMPVADGNDGTPMNLSDTHDGGV